jgi:CubicO group peptidase (beta-lactamase class C family)
MARLRTPSLCSLALTALALFSACDAAPPADEGIEAEAEPEVVAREADKALPANLEPRVTAYLEQYGRHWATFRFHGAVLVTRGDEVAVDRAYGFADLVAGLGNDPGTSFRIGTLSAQLTAVAALRLVENGTLRLDDPVGRHLPGWPGGKVITLEHLLSHRSGIPSYTDDLAFHAWKHGPRTLEDTLGLFRESPLDFDPGTDTAPSNSNVVLLGAVLEAATGQPYEQVVAEQVLEPLGMTRTRYAYSAEPQAVGMTYHEDDYLEVVQRVHPTAFGPAGGWLSTTADLAKLYRALFQGQLLSARTVELMIGGSGEGLGYGWAPNDVLGRTAIGWPGLIDGFNSAVLHVPADGTTIIVLSNSEVVPAGQLVEDIAALVYDEDAPVREEAVAVPVPMEEQVPAVGRYVLTRATEEALLAADADAEPMREAFVRREADHLVFEVPQHGRKRMFPLGKGRYFFKDGAQTQAQVITRADRSTLLVLEAAGGELRLIRVAEETAAD